MDRADKHVNDFKAFQMRLDSVNQLKFWQKNADQLYSSVQACNYPQMKPSGQNPFSLPHQLAQTMPNSNAAG